MAKIVISYRRQDSEAIAGRVRDRLAGHYGAELVFMDIDSIPFGIDFREHIWQVLSQTDVVVAIIGPKWIGARRGRPARIQEETDPVRMEIERALGHGIPVVPILVNGAHMPTPAELPDSLQNLRYRNAAQLDAGRDFHQHLDRLIRSMDQILSTASPVDRSSAALPAVKHVGSADRDEAASEPTDMDKPSTQRNEFAATPKPMVELTPSDAAEAAKPPDAARPENHHRPRRWAMITAAAVVGAMMLVGSYIYLRPLALDLVSIWATKGPISPPAPSPTTPAVDTSCQRGTAAAFYDDFKTPDGGWGESSDTHFFKDGQMVLQPSVDGATSWIYFPLLFKNVVICAEITEPPKIEDEKSDASGGVMFWATSYANYYVVQIYANGSYSVWRRLANRWIELAPRTPTSSLRRGPDAVNQLKVALVNNVATLFINGTKVGDFWGQPPGRGGAVGLFGQSEKTASNAWKFSSIAVIARKEDSPSPAPARHTETLAAFLKACDENGTPAFADEFATPDAGWGAADDTHSFKDGRIVLRPSPKSGSWWIFSPMVFQRGVVCADVKSPPQIKSSDGTAAGGVIFWATDAGNFYVAQLYTDGTYAIFRKIAGRWATVIVRAKGDGIRAGVDAVNRLKVAFEANTAKLIVNDSTVIEVRRGQPPPAGGSVGLYADSEEDMQSEWSFLRIAVMEDNRPSTIPAAVEAAPVADACKGASPPTFSDNFTAPDPSWGETGPNRYFKAGAMVLKPNTNTNIAWIYQPLVFIGATVCSVVKSPAKIKKPEDVAGGGLIFWAIDYHNYYIVTIFTDGTYTVLRKISDTWFTVVSRARSDSIRSGPDAINQIMVATSTSMVTLYINDTNIVSFWGQAPNNGGAIGLYGQSESEQENEWQFLNIAVADDEQPDPLNASKRRAQPASYPPGAREAAKACNAELAPAFFDDFTRPDPGWGPPGATYFFRDGRMVLKPKPSATEPWIYFPLIFSSAAICADVVFPAQLADAEGGSSAGIIFWASDYKNYHVAQLYPNGTYSVWRKIDGEWATVIPQSGSSAIHKGANAVNRMKIVLDHNLVTVVINDASVIAFHGQPREAGGAVGLYAESGKGSESEWQFANLVVVD